MTELATTPHNYPFSPTYAIVFFFFLLHTCVLPIDQLGACAKMSAMQGSPRGLRVPLREIELEDPLNLRRFTPAEEAANREFFEMPCPVGCELIQGQ